MTTNVCVMQSYLWQYAIHLCWFSNSWDTIPSFKSKNITINFVIIFEILVFVLFPTFLYQCDNYIFIICMRWHIKSGTFYFSLFIISHKCSQLMWHIYSSKKIFFSISAIHCSDNWFQNYLNIKSIKYCLKHTISMSFRCSMLWIGRW